MNSSLNGPDVMQHLFFTPETDYRLALGQLGREVPAVVEVLLDVTLLLPAQRAAIQPFLMADTKFLHYAYSDGVPAHDARTLLLALTRQAWTDPGQLGAAWDLSQLRPGPVTPNRLADGNLGSCFSSAELGALATAYATQGEAILELALDVDERTLLLLMLEQAAGADATPTGWLCLPALLNKLVTLSLPEADTLWTYVQGTSQSLHVEMAPLHAVPLYLLARPTAVCVH